MTTIGDVTERISTWNPSKGPEPSVFEYIDLSAVDNNLKAITAPTQVSSVDAPSRARQIVATGDVLVSTVRPNLNAVAVIPPALDGATASTGFAVLRPSDWVCGRYLFHWVRSDAFIADMVRKATGASYPAVSDRIVMESVLPVPSLAEQRRVAAILDQADELRAKRRQALAHLDDLTQSTFFSMFGNPIENPLGYRVEALADWVAQDRPITYGILKPGPHEPEGVPYVRVADMKDRGIAVDGVRRTAERIAAEYRRSRLRAGDLLMSIRGHVGRCAFVPEELEGANITQDSARLAVPEPDRAQYVRAAIESPGVQHWMARRTKGAAVRGINLGDLRTLPLPSPTPDQLRRFAELARSVERQRGVMRARAKPVDQLFASLQSQAFQGAL